MYIFLIFHCFTTIFAQLPDCSAGVRCPPGGLWSEWTTFGNSECEVPCGGCSKFFQTRTCLSTQISGCACTGDASRYIPCNFETCPYPAQKACCPPYIPMVLNKTMMCGPLPKTMREPAANCCPIGGLWSDFSGWSRIGAQWTRTRTCLSTGAGCPCIGSTSESQTACPCGQIPTAAADCTNVFPNEVPYWHDSLTIDHTTCFATLNMVGHNDGPRYCSPLTTYYQPYSLVALLLMKEVDGGCTMDYVFDCMNGETASRHMTAPLTCDTYNPLCFPLSDHTLLFAYSNDLDPQVVKHSLYWVIEHSGRGTFSKFGSIRFDTKNAGNFSFFNDLGSIQQSVYSNLPDPSLGFSDDHTGSDILNVLQRFLENTNGVPLCGSLISILLKRHPMETYSSDLLAHLRYHHIFVRTLMSNTPILGENSQIMYNLSGLTNGMAGFLEDQHMGEDSNYFSAVFYDVFQIYSINPIYKSGMERTDFPILQFPKCNYSEVYTWIEMSVQDHGPLDKFRSFNLTLTNTKNSGDQINVYSDYTTFGSTNFFTFVYLTQSANYSVKLLLEFSDSEPENLQFRIWTGWEYDPIDYWLPFTNWN